MRRVVPACCLFAAALSACAPVSYDPVRGYTGDRDGDGWADVREDDVGSDPQNAFNWDFGSGQWPDFTDEAARDGVAGSGYGVGDTIPDFVSVDQYGQPVPFYTFYGYVVILDFVAGWCEPCQEVASGSQDFWVDHRLDGVLVVHQVLDDYDADGWVVEGFARRWADDYALDLPVVVDDDQRAFGGFWSEGVTDGTIPFQVVLDRHFVIRDAFVGVDGAEAAQVLALELAE